MDAANQAANSLRAQLELAEERIKELEDYIRSDDMLDLLENALRGIQERADTRDMQFATMIQVRTHEVVVPSTLTSRAGHR